MCLYSSVGARDFGVKKKSRVVWFLVSMHACTVREGWESWVGSKVG
jgi:hypothetical protein